MIFSVTDNIFKLVIIIVNTWEPFPGQLLGKEHISQLGLSVRLDGIVGRLLKVDVVEIHLPALMSQRTEGCQIYYF